MSGETCPDCSARCDDEVCECPANCPTNVDIPAREFLEDD